jgi:CRISPR-associated protein Csm4
MRLYRAKITPRSAFGTPPKGDTLFGQLCWAVRNHFGVERLVTVLDGYTVGHPFAVVSDAFPAEHLPRPFLPSKMFDEVVDAGRKALKKRIWLPMEHVLKPMECWLMYCKSAGEVSGAVPEECPQPHNTLNRETGTTGTGQFAPYTMPQLWYGRKKADSREMDDPVQLDVYVVLDEERLSIEELRSLLSAIGEVGFGRDASIGLGKFMLESFDPFDLPAQDDADAWLTLAPCAPQGLGWHEDSCFYRPFTRFGRHGDIGVLSEKPFKTPLLLADTGAVLTPSHFERRVFTGQGLGGGDSLSKAVHGTVHQGYAPVVAVKLPRGREER